MIIDCHGPCITTPAAHQSFRDAQLAHLADPSLPAPARAEISDEEIRSSIEDNQLKMLLERETDLMILSPKASAMAHHLDNPEIAQVVGEFQQ